MEFNLTMKYKDFITESKSESYKTKITKEEIVSLIKQNCKTIDIEKPLYRSVREKDHDYILYEGRKGTRASISGSNHLNLIYDEVVKKHDPKLPLRTNSVITSNNMKDSKAFGEHTYVVLPYDNTVLAMAYDYDFIKNEITVAGKKISMLRLHTPLSDTVVNPSSYKEMISELLKELKSGESVSANFLQRVFKAELKKEPDEFTDDDLNEFFMREFSIENQKYKFGSYSKLGISKMTSERHEIWMSDKCVAVKVDLWDEIKELLK